MTLALIQATEEEGPGLLAEFWAQAMDIWSGGGWAMWAIAVVAFVIFSTGMGVYMRLRRLDHDRVPERIWRRWIDFPAERHGPIGELLDQVTNVRTIRDSVTVHRQVQVQESTPFERDLKVMKICVSAAPLVGLLGTVTGMISTFKALQTGSGGDKTMGMVAEGISEALITTETGLVVALPGLFFQYVLSRRFDQYKAFLAHLETVCSQMLYSRSGQFERQMRPERRAARRAALVEITRMLQRETVPAGAAAVAAPETQADAGAPASEGPHSNGQQSNGQHSSGQQSSGQPGGGEGAVPPTPGSADD